MTMNSQKASVQGPITVNINSNKSQIQVEDEVQLIAEIKNNTSESIYANHRLVVNYPYCPIGHGDLLVNLTGPEEYINMKDRKVNPIRLNIDNWKQILVAEKISKKIRVSYLYSFQEPGEYRIQLGYDNRNSLTSDPQRRELIYSNVLIINVVK